VADRQLNRALHTIVMLRQVHLSAGHPGEVGVYGWSEVNQRLVVAVAEHLRLVEPST
jgi:hypothetical protein